MTTEAEELVLGAALLTPDALRFATPIISGDDFANVNYGKIFQIMVDMHAKGQAVEVFTVTAEAERQGIPNLQNGTIFHQMIHNVGSSATITHYAEQVKEAATRRHLTVIAQTLLRDAGDTTAAASEAAQAARDALTNVKANQAMATKTLGTILDESHDYDWLVPGLFERGDRLVLTGFEGSGKTTWLRQMAVCLASGIHPINLNHLTQPHTVLVVDAENMESQWRAQTRKMAATAANYGHHSPRDNIHIHAKGRIDITKDSTLGEIHRLVDQHEPDFLMIGPLYKITPKGITNDDDAAPVINALDSLRDRGLVLLMEGHAKKQDAMAGMRDLAPRGSAALMGWPEFGFGLYPDTSDDGQTYSSRIIRWRGDRDQGRDWPKELMKGGPFPWTADNVAPEIRRNIYLPGEI